MGDRLHEYRGKDIVVRYSLKRCIHAAECVTHLPEVFDPKRRPWVNPDAAGASEVAAAIRRCPTGALSYEFVGAPQPEPSETDNTVMVRTNGPLFLRGNIELQNDQGHMLLRSTRLALCRCGSSTNKPFCDGNHTKAGFADPAALADCRVTKAEGIDESQLTVTVAPNGPLLLNGPLELRGASVDPAFKGNHAALCRCGSSAAKPYCDGTHKRIGFNGE
jgi:CDGSH-type Zn-finger protein/uncharacterized Fe-S cluster protein YjdI